MAKRKKYLVTADSEAYACSLVTSPAVEEEFLTFSKDEQVQMQFADEEKHMVIGVVAIPNKPIYRVNEDGEEYDLIFTAEAIEQMEKRFLKDFRQYNVTLQHQEDANGIWLVEQWLKADQEKDKSVAMGLSADLPVGSWFQVYYVDSNDVWQRIKSGELRGFSLEALIGMEEVDETVNNFNKTKNMCETEENAFFAKMKALFESVLESFSMSERKTETNLEAEEPAPQADPAPTTVVEPKVEPAQVEPQPAPQPVEEPQVVDPQPVEEPAKVNPLEELVKSLQSELESLKQSNTDLLGKIADLEKLPSAKPINTNVTNGGGGDTYSNWREQMARML